MDYIKWSREGWSGDERLAFMWVFSKRKKREGLLRPPDPAPFESVYVQESLYMI